MITNNKRLGRIKITRELATSPDHEANRRLLFQAFHPYHIETTHQPGYLMYYGVSESFEEVPDDCVIPEYTGKYDDDGEGTISLFFEAV